MPISPGTAPVASQTKGWTKFAGATGTTSASENVTSVNRSGTGVYQINWTNAFATANYVVTYGYEDALALFVRITAQAAGSVTLTIITPAGAAADPTAVHVTAHGTLA